MFDFRSQRGPDTSSAGDVSRRRFLRQTAVTVAASTISFPIASWPQRTAPSLSRQVASPDERRERAFQIRYEAAVHNRDEPREEHLANGDESRFPQRLGNYSKGLPHNDFGEVEDTAYQGLLEALRAGAPEDFEAIRMGGRARLTNPQAGLAFDLQGADAQHFTAPPHPALASAEAAGEAVELYWAALLRDVNFLSYGAHGEAEAAASNLSQLQDFRGPKQQGQVTPHLLFRGHMPGVTRGPFLSQFLWKGTPFGAEYVERRMRTSLPGVDFLSTYEEWLGIQNGDLPTARIPVDPIRRYVRTGRDLAVWVHRDVLFQAYFNAGLILGTSSDSSDEITSGGIGCPLNPGNPYLRSSNQMGFATFGLPYIQTALCEVATRALKATWFQKWFVHRRLRPEEYGGLVHLQQTRQRYPGILHADVLSSPALERLHDRQGSYLLPQAFPEGCPTHPSYTAGHATVAGACVTVLKALFDENHVIPNPVVPAKGGTALAPYRGQELTVGGELNKLAWNVAVGRNIAGVHWRTDAVESMKLGEAIAISLLRDHRSCYNEPFEGFAFTRFDGTRTTV